MRKPAVNDAHRVNERRLFWRATATASNQVRRRVNIASLAACSAPVPGRSKRPHPPPRPRGDPRTPCSSPHTNFPAPTTPTPCARAIPNPTESARIIPVPRSDGLGHLPSALVSRLQPPSRPSPARPHEPPPSFTTFLPLPRPVRAPIPSLSVPSPSPRSHAQTNTVAHRDPPSPRRHPHINHG